jgi:hypothetical protein
LLLGASVVKTAGMTAKRIDRRLAAAAAIGAIAAYVTLAYVLAPFFWRHFVGTIPWLAHNINH